MKERGDGYWRQEWVRADGRRNEGYECSVHKTWPWQRIGMSTIVLHLYIPFPLLIYPGRLC